MQVSEAKEAIGWETWEKIIKGQNLGKLENQYKVNSIEVNTTKASDKPYPEPRCRFS